jgi:poly-gamma-glutamate synthesis protein (capsule biosynthesis protein)
MLCLVGLTVLCNACAQQTGTFTPDPLSQATLQSLLNPTLSPSPTPEPLSPPFDTWLDPALPASLQKLIGDQPDLRVISSREQALISFSSSGSTLSGTWTYLLVGPFYTMLDDIPFTELQEFWKTGSSISDLFDTIILSENTKNHLAQFWGEPTGEGVAITLPEEILPSIWNNPRNLALIPFEDLNPSYTVISVDNQNPLTFVDGTELENYPLAFSIYSSLMRSELLPVIELKYLSNYDRAKLTSVALTGVTAMVRNTAAIMEEQGVLYPGIDIQDILLSADITHINNEVPFAADCPPPDPDQDSLAFCSSDKYLELLDSLGTDIVELSGDHFGDHGPEAMLHSLDLYQQNGYILYGGGKTLQDGLEPVFLEHNGNRIAFIGCNGKLDERYATASLTRPGASRCDFEWMIPEIRRLSDSGYLVIATMQHEEIDSFFPVALQLYDFRRLSEAGAVIVSGSQAHHPQGLEISETNFIHYGLGNLFFDQWYLATHFPKVHINKDKALIDFHYFYDGKYINTRLIPLQFIDNARPRPMTNDEKKPFLEEIYNASKWHDQWIYLYPKGYFDQLEEE